MITIGQVMNRQVQAIHCEATVGEAIESLIEQHTGGAPVVNDAGELVGMISELAMIDVVFDAAVKEARVTKYMTADVHAVQPSDPLSRAAQLFALYAFRRLPVVNDGKLVGIFTRRDLMKHALRTHQFLTDPLIELFPSLTPTG